MWKSKKHHVVDVAIKVDNNGFQDDEDGIGLRKKVEGYLKEMDGEPASNGHSNGTGLLNGSATSHTKNGVARMVLEDGNHTTDTVNNEDSKSQTQTHSNGSAVSVSTDSCNNNGISPLTMKHSLWTEIDRVTLDQLHYAKLGVGEGGWSLFAKDGEMKMYKREEETDGLIIDPLKAVHTVKGVTAREMCHYFFFPDVRTEWETTLETMTILETISEDSIVFHQVHKRIWPATQRDALFWSHIRQVRDGDGDGKNNTWIVCNHSSKHVKDPEAGNKSKDKYIRIHLKVSLVCQTVIDSTRRIGPDGQITRDDLTCHISYCSVVNPGGWAPASGVRAVYKREYPRFLKKFTQYVIDKCKDQPIMF